MHVTWINFQFAILETKYVNKETFIENQYFQQLFGKPIQLIDSIQVEILLNKQISLCHI